MTKQQAEALAKFDRHYYARCLRCEWMVWDMVSDHMVEFDAAAIAKAGR